MKAAMWGVGILLLGFFGLVLVNLFGDITVTNQQDYTLMKNSVEAAMYDAVDIPRYRVGFCLCTNVSKTNVNGQEKWVFNTSDDYVIVDPIEGASTCPTVSGKTCELLQNEMKIDTEVFAESLIRRFSETVKGNKNYQIIIKDIIEYPPQVSVMVKSGNSYNIFSASAGDDFNITNKIDAILEKQD